MTLLSIKNLEVQFKHYEGITTALKKISLDIQEGEKVALQQAQEAKEAQEQAQQQARARAMQFQMRSSMRKNNDRRAQSNNVTTSSNQGRSTMPQKYNVQAGSSRGSTKKWNYDSNPTSTNI